KRAPAGAGASLQPLTRVKLGKLGILDGDVSQRLGGLLGLHAGGEDDVVDVDSAAEGVAGAEAGDTGAGPGLEQRRELRGCLLQRDGLELDEGDGRLAGGTAGQSGRGDQ